LGFGTLFFGYFLLLNITYFTFTDLIAALIMAMGLYKLSEINSQFKNAFYSSIAFSVIGIVELVCGSVTMLSPLTSLEALLDYTALVRCIVIAILTLFILSGIERVSVEVGLGELARRARISMPVSLAIYLVSALLSVPLNVGETFTRVLSVASVLTLLAIFITVSVNLVTVYRAYMRICMPEDVDNEVPDKPSRFEFINRHREHTAEKQREYAEYKLERLKKKNSKKKKK